jgi:uncharacterized protein
MLRYYSFLFLACNLFFIIAATTASAQDSLHLHSIPFPLQWEIKPVKYTLVKNSLTIVAGAKTDMFRDPNVTYNTDNAPKLLFTPDSNFVFSTGIRHPFTSKWDGGAIVLIEDSLNWIKFCFEKDYTGTHRVVSEVTKDISDDCNSIAVTGNLVYYKIAKAGNVITLYYSLDNKNWFLVRHLQFNNRKDLKIGFLAQSPTGKQCTVQFSGIRYQAKKIGDPYAGE